MVRKYTLRKKKKSSKKFRKLICAPNVNRTNKYTCYTNEHLLKMKELWNKRYPWQKITSNQPQTIWNNFKMFMQNACDNEKCWLTQSFVKNKIKTSLLHNTFAPFHPVSWIKDRNIWLDNYDLKRVMKQYEIKYPTFSFIGPSPIDYDFVYDDGECVWDDLCHFNLSSYLGKKQYIGIIFNTDTHDGPGQHWICLFINLKRKHIYYFDSVANTPPVQIETLINTIVNQGKQLHIDFSVYKNQIKHQYKYSECGMYCLYVIISLLKQVSFDYFQTHRITDEEMVELRSVYYNSPK